MRERRRPELADLVREAASTTVDSRVLVAAFSYFGALRLETGWDLAMEIIEEYPYHDAQTVEAAISYVASEDTLAPPDAADALRPIVTDREERLLMAAVTGLGFVGTSDDARLLEDLYRDPRTPTDTRARVLVSLGRLADVGSRELLEAIASNPDEELVLRRFAVDGLGHLGLPDVMPVMRDTLASDDAFLRLYTVGALSRFQTEEAEMLVRSALRDANWRVRKEAVSGAGRMGAESTLEALFYMARRDPEAPVRVEAVRALGTLASEHGVRAATDALVELAEGTSYSFEVRVEAIRLLAQHSPGDAVPVVESIIDEQWERESSAILDRIGRIITATPSSTFIPLYERLTGHGEYLIRMYGIRGIGALGRRQDADLILEFAAVDYPIVPVRREALAALELMGVEPPEADDAVQLSDGPPHAAVDDEESPGQ